MLLMRAVPPTPQDTLAKLSLPPLPSPSDSEIPDIPELPPPVPAVASPSGAQVVLPALGDTGDEDMFASLDEDGVPLTSTHRAKVDLDSLIKEICGAKTTSWC